MVSDLAKPQCGQVSTDSGTTSLIEISLPHHRGIAGVCGRAGQGFRLGLVRVIGDDRRLPGEIDLDGAHAGDFLERLLHRD